jgi:hypothetical protein
MALPWLRLGSLLPCPGTISLVPETRLPTPALALWCRWATYGPTYLGYLGKLPKTGVPDASDIKKLHFLEGEQRKDVEQKVQE